MFEGTEKKFQITITSSEYIPSPEHWKEMFRKYHFYEAKERIAIDEMKINRALFSFNNTVIASAVEYMCNNFEEDAWMIVQQRIDVDYCY